MSWGSFIKAFNTLLVQMLTKLFHLYWQFLREIQYARCLKVRLKLNIQMTFPLQKWVFILPLLLIHFGLFWLIVISNSLCMPPLEKSMFILSYTYTHMSTYFGYFLLIEGKFQLIGLFWLIVISNSFCMPPLEKSMFILSYTFTHICTYLGYFFANWGLISTHWVSKSIHFSWYIKFSHYAREFALKSHMLSKWAESSFERPKVTNSLTIHAR